LFTKTNPVEKDDFISNLMKFQIGLSSADLNGFDAAK
jgi:hypothetical protein